MGRDRNPPQRNRRKNVGAFAGVHVAARNRRHSRHRRGPAGDPAPQATPATRPRLRRARFAKAATEHRGAANRTYRNMLVYLAADSDRIAEVDAAVRDYLGWKNVSERAHELGLTLQQIQQATERKERASTTVDDRILGAYHWILAPDWPQSSQSFALTATKAEGAAASLAERVSKRMISDSTLNMERAASLIRLDIANHLSTLWEEHGHISVKELWGYYADYPYMPRLRDHEVIDAGIREFSQGHMYWQQEGFAIADGIDDNGRYLGLVLPTDDRPVTVRNTTLLVRPDLAEQQRSQERQPEPAPAGSTPVPEHTDVGADTRVVPTPTQATYTRFYGARLLNPERYAADFSKIINEILQPLAGVDGTRLEVRVEVTAVNPTGFDESKRRTVSENAETLRFEQHGFEEL